MGSAGRCKRCTVQQVPRDISGWCGYSALTATPARANPARRKIAQNREGKMIDTSLMMPLLQTVRAAIARIAGATAFGRTRWLKCSAPSLFCRLSWDSQDRRSSILR